MTNRNEYYSEPLDRAEEIRTELEQADQVISGWRIDLQNANILLQQNELATEDKLRLEELVKTGTEVISRMEAQKDQLRTSIHALIKEHQYFAQMLRKFKPKEHH